MEMFCILRWVTAYFTRLHTSVKTHWTTPLRSRWFMVCLTYLTKNIEKCCLLEVTRRIQTEVTSTTWGPLTLMSHTQVLCFNPLNSLPTLRGQDGRETPMTSKDSCFNGQQRTCTQAVPWQLSSRTSYVTHFPALTPEPRFPHLSNRRVKTTSQATV